MTLAERRYRMRGIGRACDAFALSRADRLNVATVLLDRNVESFNQLSVDELRYMWFAFNGAVLVAHNLMERKNRRQPNGIHP